MSNSPRYDQKIGRKGGFMYASECDLENLQYWFEAKSRPSSDPKYADRDAAQAKKLSYWVKFREADPYSRWKGIRGDSEVVAAQPSAKPVIHSWDAPKTEPAPPPVDPAPGDHGDAWEADSDGLPF